MINTTKATVLEALHKELDRLWSREEEINRKNTTGSVLSSRALDDLGHIAAKRARVDAAIADIESNGAWEPVEDGEIGSFMYVDNGGKLIGVFAGDDYTDWYATDELPDDIRLCRRTTAQQQPAAWEPDWSKLEPWVMYWAVDALGNARVFEYKPVVLRDSWSAYDNIILALKYDPPGRDDVIGKVNLPIGTDWRTTLRKRPSEATPQQTNKGEVT